MHRKTLAAALISAAFASGNAHAQVEIQWWHSMGGALGDALKGLADKFNASQKEYKVVASNKGSYPESMTAAIDWLSRRKEVASGRIGAFGVGAGAHAIVIAAAERRGTSAPSSSTVCTPTPPGRSRRESSRGGNSAGSAWASSRGGGTGS